MKPRQGPAPAQSGQGLGQTVALTAPTAELHESPLLSVPLFHSSLSAK